MRYILSFLIILLLQGAHSYIPNCKFSLTNDIQDKFLIHVIPKNKFCCDALLPECIECQEEAINGIPLNDYCDYYACNNNKQPLDEDGEVMDINDKFDFDIKCKKNLNDREPYVKETCGKGSHYEFFNCVEPCEHSDTEDGVLSYRKIFNVCKIDECKAGYYLYDDTCYKCHDSLKAGYHCPAGGENSKGIPCPEGYYREQYMSSETCIKAPCFIYKVVKAVANNTNGKDCQVITCNEGYFLNHTSRRCEACNDKLRDGYYCPKGSTQMLSNPDFIGELCPPGTYRSSDMDIDSAECFICPDIYPFSPSGSKSISDCSIIQTSHNVLEDMTSEEICLKYTDNIDNCKKYIMIQPLFKTQMSYGKKKFHKHRQKSKHLFNADWDKLGLHKMTTNKFTQIRRFMKNNLIRTRLKDNVNTFSFKEKDKKFFSTFLNDMFNSYGLGDGTEIRHKLFHTAFDLACEISNNVHNCNHEYIHSIEFPTYEFEFSRKFNLSNIEKIITMKGGSVETPIKIHLEDLLDVNNKLYKMVYSPLNEFEIIAIYYKGVLKYVLEGINDSGIKMLYPKSEKNKHTVLSHGTTWDEKLYIPNDLNKKTFSIAVGSLQIGNMHECTRPSDMGNTVVNYETDLSEKKFNVSLLCKEGFYGMPSATCNNGKYKIIDNCKKCPATFNRYCPMGNTDMKGVSCPKNTLWDLNNQMKKCTSCLYNQWSDTQDCNSCPDNKAIDPESLYEDERQCTFCKKGYRGNAQKKCEKCPDGMFSTSRSINKNTCDLCDIDYKWNGTDCVKCPFGYTNIKPTRAHGPPQKCIFCEPGFHSDGLNCLPCPVKETNTIVTNRYIETLSCNECSENYKFDGTKCIKCRQGYTNTIPTRKITRYYCHKCDEDYINSYGICEPCPNGYYHPRGMSIVDFHSEDKCNVCEKNWRVTQSGHCEKCSRGKFTFFRNHVNLKGTTWHGGGTICEEKTCGENEHVDNFDCKQCSKGRWNEPGDKTLGGDTPCEKIFCERNHSVFDNECIPCGKYTHNERRDDATGPNTVCHYIKCGKNEHVVNHACAKCPKGQYNKGGDYIFNGETECDGIYISPVKIVKSISMPNESDNLSDFGEIIIIIIVLITVGIIIFMVCRWKQPNVIAKIRKTSSPSPSDNNSTSIVERGSINSNNMIRYRRFNMAKRGKIDYRAVKYDF